MVDDPFDLSPLPQLPAESEAARLLAVALQARGHTAEAIVEALSYPANSLPRQQLLAQAAEALDHLAETARRSAEAVRQHIRDGHQAYGVELTPDTARILTGRRRRSG